MDIQIVIYFGFADDICQNENSCTFSLTPGMGLYTCQLDNKYDIDLPS